MELWIYLVKWYILHILVSEKLKASDVLKSKFE